MSLNPDQVKLNDPPGLHPDRIKAMGRGRNGVGGEKTEIERPVVDGLDVAGEVLRLEDRDVVAAGRRHRRDRVTSRLPCEIRRRFGRLDSLHTPRGWIWILHTHPQSSYILRIQFLTKKC